MGYQESYVTASTEKRFNKIVTRIKELGKDFYDSYGTYLVEIITFDKSHYPFKKGQKVIYFVGERYLQNEIGCRLLGYTNEFFKNMDDHKMFKHLDEFEKYHLEKYYTEDVEPKGIWEHAGVMVTVKHESFNWE